MRRNGNMLPLEETDVIIMAGGKGRRLHPYTVDLPKPLMPLGDKTVLDLLLDHISKNGFRRVTLALSHLGDLIRESAGDGSRFGLEIRYSTEAEPLSTAGPLKLLGDLSRTFVVINGDILTNLDLDGMLEAHHRRRAAATIAVQQRRVSIDYGVVRCGSDDTLETYIEKPHFEFRLSLGINVLDRAALEHIGEGESLDMPTLLLRMRDAGLAVFTHETNCSWLDIGRPEDYERAAEEYSNPRREASQF